ncbi:MAG: beta-eliminating lyase-related protein [Candidatus Dormibacteraeota bacterium]|nr:beta-eliminating lyase-related protein [Candidatus Dormibacteraeota bacterium]
MATVDLRSDTLTMPSPAMREAMAGAELGDDVWGEDPTINRLQQVAAERLGKEAALFVSSGTMGNLLGLLVSARSGQEIIADADSHTFLSETGGAAALGGIQIMPVKTAAGVMAPEQIADAIREEDVHHPRTVAVTFEDTHNYHGGIAWPLAALRAASDQAHRSGLSVHLDGARLFNAAVATNSEPREIAACADTVTFCLSKGLGAPVGSVLLGPAEKIAEAKRWRKMLGGGMREIGMLGAAGLFALDNMVDRLAEDHANARTLAEGLAEMDGVRLDLDRVQTNLVIFELDRMAPDAFVAECDRRGVKGAIVSRRHVRFVTHYGISAANIQQTLKVAGEVLAGA